VNSLRQPLPLILCILCALFAWAGIAQACSCSGALPPNQSLANADAVFTGKVVKLTKTGTVKDMPDYYTGYDVTFELGMVIKGKGLQGKKTATIHTGMGMGDCGYDFAEGKEYLVYANGIFPNLRTDICTRTQPLEGVGEEILELLDQLPKIAIPPSEPQLVLKGTIDDAGYKGYVFELRNYLHERIFYSEPVAQVFRDGKWEDYPINSNIGPREDPSAEEAVRMLDEDSKYAAEDAANRDGLWGVRYLSRKRAEAVFAPRQSQSLPWRIGYGYTTEKKMTPRTNLSKARHFVWGPRIEGTTEAKKLTFDEAFGSTGLIPFPLGTNPSDAGTGP
jgi:hypothetical protein